MIVSTFNTVFFQPLYNGLVFLMDVLPWADAGVAVILFTVIIKLFLIPLSKKAIVTQIKMKAIDPQLKDLKEKHKHDQKKYAQSLLELYRTEGINPFSSILLIFIQLPIIFALYFVFLKGFPVVQTELLYSFVPEPENINLFFLGIVDVTSKSIVLALCAAVTNFFQIRYSMPLMKTDPKDRSFKADFTRSMNIQMRYVFPVIVFFIAYSISAAVAIYWTTSNIFAIGQELYFRRQFRHKGYKQPQP